MQNNFRLISNHAVGESPIEQEIASVFSGEIYRRVEAAMKE